MKLKWKCDWPMRWDFYKISFEPGGKDHSTPGSSYTVGSDIIKEIFQREAPEYTMYDFVKLKGENKKISSSSGGLRLKEVSKIYTDELLLFIFSSCRPSKEISLSFDLDVLKIYEDFYKIERIYYNIEEDKNEKSLINKKRIYELCQYKNQETQKKIPYQIDFRHLTTIIQVNDFDFEKVERFYKENIKTEFEKKRLKQMFNCAKNWIENYAPDDMKFKINETFPKVQISGKEKEFLLELKKVVENLNEEIEIYNLVKDFSSKNNLDIKEIFKLCYKIIISKNKGPKITSLIKNSKDKVLKILDNLK